ncbi:hypothetical protein PPL_10358 [Heterostelium album PN500]|uniref:Uncharacterized protein n=1 Tax=Heterostelium pallidum (strain ATCC 26659 / Pp 5 / PN500) TaxID=670386 RepID=D3BQ38_HETP5|nr:hypothetical protein PPL_10358 [Heterostelium album PN500]EFA76589.1 hypothetical protein PPL_10358 [Heterostelium album PN500]|eukprot:XP_020428721.1 hypothetical protein PPL_10358 [Heterostelium album PN500]
MNDLHDHILKTTNIMNTDNTTTTPTAVDAATATQVDVAGATDKPKLTKNQKKRLKEKEKKQQAKTEVAADDQLDEETKYQRQLEWAIAQLDLGTQRRDATKEQIEEAQSVIRKLKSKKNTDVQKAHLMHVVFGGKLEKKMKEMPIPESYYEEKAKQEEEKLKLEQEKQQALESNTTTTTTDDTNKN